MVLLDRRLRRLPRLLRRGPGARARRRAARQGLDVAVYPVPAYSTLGRLPTGGWLADPLLNTFIGYPEGELARLVFHELAHQIAFAPGDTLFNESFASAVEKIGAARWLAERAARRRAPNRRAEARRADFRALTSRYRDELARLYASAQGDDDKRAGKAAHPRPPARRLRGDEGRALERLRRLRRLVRAGEQRRLRRPRQLHRARPGVREAVRARRPRLPALLRRGQAARGDALARAARRARGRRRHHHPT